MQVTHPKLIRIVYDNRIGIRNIQARFYNVGANQNLVPPVNKIQQSTLQGFGFHLPVRHCNIGIRNQLVNHACDFWKRLYPVMHKENLPAAIDFVVDGILDNFMIEDPCFRMNRLPIRGRRPDHGKVAGSHQGEL